MQSISDISIASITDDFIADCYSYEVNIYRLNSTDIQSQLDSINPRLLFVTPVSDTNNLWYDKLSKASSELNEVIDWCRQKRIPAVFWDLNDSVRSEDCCTVAVLFDYICTSDLDSIEKYKSLTNKHNVFFLPFCIQPRVFNPVVTAPKLDKCCLTYGSQDCAKAEDFVKCVSDYKDIDIFFEAGSGDGADAEKSADDEALTDKADNLLLKFKEGIFKKSEINNLHKRYSYSLALNPSGKTLSCNKNILQSLACNTFVLSDYAAGSKILLGDLILSSADGKDLVRRFKNLDNAPYRRRKLQLLGLRKVFSEFTCRNALAYIFEKSGISAKDFCTLPAVTVWAVAESGEDFERLTAMYRSQSYQHKNMVIITSLKTENVDEGIVLLRSLEDFETMLNNEDRDGNSTSDYFACFSVNNYYGKNYVLDLVIASIFDNAGNYSKSVLFEVKDKDHFFNDNVHDETYTYSDKLWMDESLLNKETLLLHLQHRRDTDKDSRSPHSLIYARNLKVDPFNYCRNANLFSLDSKFCSQFEDDEGVTDCGCPLRDLQNMAETVDVVNVAETKRLMMNSVTKKLSIDCIYHEIGNSLSGSGSLLSKIFSMFHIKNSIPASFKIIGNELHISFNLPNSQHRYIIFPRKFAVSELAVNDILTLYLKIHGAKIGIAYYFYNNDKMIASKLCNPNCNIQISIPGNATHIKLGLRLAGIGNSVIEGLFFEEFRELPKRVFNIRKTVIIVHRYPSYNDIYNYAFVHSRVRGYMAKGEKPLVFVLNYGELDYYEYEGVDIVSGNSETLDELLKCNITTVLVHFMTPGIWKSLCVLPDTIKIFVWCHGSDILLFNRRSYNYITKEEIEFGKRTSESLRQFWLPILTDIPKNLHLIFVSKFLADVVMQDYGVVIPKSSYSIINNPIDTGIFKYKTKKPEDRYKILSVRPFATRMYANDLTMKAINLLSSRKDFDKFEILIVGDGKLFDNTVSILKKFPNVKVKRSFLSHYEIAELHSRFGIFLCPSRYDTQGVSRDEARSSGLVPVTTRVAAIPEFVDDNTAMLTEQEDPESIAKAISYLVDNPDVFEKMSQATSLMVKNNLTLDKIITQELNLIKNNGGDY